VMVSGAEFSGEVNDCGGIVAANRRLPVRF